MIFSEVVYSTAVISVILEALESMRMVVPSGQKLYNRKNELWYYWWP